MDETYDYCSRPKRCDYALLFVSVEALPAWLCAVDVGPAYTHPFDALDFAICHLHQPQSPYQIPGYSIDLLMQYYDFVSGSRQCQNERLTGQIGLFRSIPH